MINLFSSNKKSTLIVTLFMLFFSFNIYAQPFSVGHDGNFDGVKVWQLPNAPDGTRPTQSWHAIGSTSDGDIYISGHDHTNNSMLYRLNIKTDTLKWVGDAATASIAASNWENGEVVEKFHTRPIEHNGNMYVATLSHSELNDGFLSTRGFHWYKYNIEQNTFIDLSANEVGGVGAEHLQIVTIQIDKKNNILYGATIPECKIVKYDINTGVTEVLGTPWGDEWNDYIYSNRVMWVDSGGRLYISAGSDITSIPNRYNGEPTATFNHIWYYDPILGFGELPDFQLQGANAIEIGQWNLNHTKFYMCDDRGHIYCFEDEGAKWKYLGTPSENFSWVWTMNLSADEKKIYLGNNNNWVDQPIYEFDIETGATKELCIISQVDNSIGSQDFMTGYDSWDNKGNFYVSNFSQPQDDNVRLIRINPVRMKVDKGLLPSLVTVNLSTPENDFIVSSVGNTENELEIIFKVDGKYNDEIVHSTYLKKTINSLYNNSEIITVEDLNLPVSLILNEISITLIPEGNDYVVGNQNIELTLPIDQMTNHVDLELDVAVVNQHEISIYPNPVKDLLYIQSDVLILDMSVYDAIGNLVYSKSDMNTNNSIQLNNLSSGVYFLYVSTIYKQGIYKVIKI
jgi:hypothetical protein